MSCFRSALGWTVLLAPGVFFDNSTHLDLARSSFYITKETRRHDFKWKLMHVYTVQKPTGFPSETREEHEYKMPS